MSPSVDLSQAQVSDPPVAKAVAAAVDVPEMLADRIGNLYASEERRRRNQRTERMIMKAQSFQ